MKPIREDVIHVAMRAGMKALGWTLIAGQFPNGSDDELRALNVVDPEVARDRSPMPRKHALDKLVPDLVAYRPGRLVVVEAKPSYDLGDEAKLVRLLTIRRDDFDAALAPMLVEAGIHERPAGLVVTPVLAFGEGSSYVARPGFGYIFVGRDLSFEYVEPAVIFGE